MNETDSSALSEREEQVLLYATKGLTDKEIARKLGISTATVLTYWMRIRNKLGGSNRAELVACAVRKDAQGEIDTKQTENQLLLGEILRRMQAEDQVRENEEKYRTLFNGSSDWILVYHLDANRRPGKFIEANDAACERLGHAREDLLQMTILDLAAKDSPSMSALTDNILETKRALFECLFCSKANMWVPTEVSASLFTLNGKPTVQCICRDLTYRKEAEHALKDAYEAMERRVQSRMTELQDEIVGRKQAQTSLGEANLFAESLINSSLDGLLAFDRELKLTVWNPVMERIYGLPKDKVLGKPAPDVLPYLADIGEMDFWKRALEGEVVKTNERAFKVPETDRQGVFEGYYSPLEDADGNIIGGLGVIHEVVEPQNGKALVPKAKRASLK